ncbi:unnamed protein product [Ectocarpus fasciculatus]
MGVCLLVTVSLFYVLVKRYQNIRETGLSGVELVRALAVDDPGGVRLRGVSRKARAMCMDFKYDPEGVFRERSAGRGFEMYPTQQQQQQQQRGARGASSSSGSGSPSSSSALRGPSRTKGEGKEEEEDEEETETAAAGGSGKGGQGRRRGRWPWDRGGRGGDDSSISQGSDGANDTEETPITQGEEQRRRQAHSPPTAATPSGVGGSANEGSRSSNSNSNSNSNSPDAAELGQPPPPPLPPPPPSLERDGRQVIRASELNASCSVCLFEYYVDEAVTLLPCGHLYHTECIDIWMRDHVDCPYCRADMNVWCNSGGEFSGAGVYRNQTAAAAATLAAPNSNASGDGGRAVAGGAGNVPPSTAALSSEDPPSSS